MANACNNTPVLSKPNRLDCNLINKINEKVENSTGVWADFNCKWRLWSRLQQSIISSGLYLRNDVPNEPNPNDYEDLNEERTFSC